MTETVIETRNRRHSPGHLFAGRSLAASSLVVVASVCAAAWPMHAAASLALAQKYACVACHQPAAKVVGPSWKDIGARYGEGKGTAAQLVASIKAGSSGKWGPMPMPAQAQVPDADAQALARWLLDGAK